MSAEGKKLEAGAPDRPITLASGPVLFVGVTDLPDGARATYRGKDVPYCASDETLSIQEAN